MIINGIDCEEVTKERIIADMAKVPCFECYYSEKSRVLIILEVNIYSKRVYVYHIIPQNENGLFWQAKDRALIEELVEVQTEVVEADKAKLKKRTQ